jgi:hypothetical protein
MSDLAKQVDTMRQGLVGVVDAAILAARAMPQPDPSDFVLGVIPQISVLQGAAFGFNLEVQRQSEKTFLLVFRRPGPQVVVLRARFRFALRASTTGKSHVTGASVLVASPPFLIEDPSPGMLGAIRQALGIDTTNAPAIYARSEVPILATANDVWAIPRRDGGWRRVEAKDIPLGLILSVLAEMGAARPTLSLDAPMPTRARLLALRQPSKGVKLLLDLLALPRDVHVQVDRLVAGDAMQQRLSGPGPVGVDLPGGYVLGASHAVLELALNEKGDPQTTTDDPASLTMLGVGQVTGHDERNTLASVLTLGPPDILVRGGVFQAFLETLTAEAEKLAKTLSQGLTDGGWAIRRMLGDASAYRLIARIERGEKGKKWDSNLVMLRAASGSSGDTLIFRVPASVEGGTLDPKVAIQATLAKRLHLGVLDEGAVIEDAQETVNRIARSLARFGEHARELLGP